MPDQLPVRGRQAAWLRRLSVITAVVTYFLVILGSTVRVTESGMGCPGWPLCYGALGPIDRFHTLLEQSHRYLAATVTVLVLATALAALRHQRPRPAATRPAVLAVGVIAIQIVLGAVTVFTHNAPPTVAAHLLMGLVLLSTVTVTAVTALAPAPRHPATRRLGPLGWWATAGAFLLLVSGSLVVDGGASAACPSWPLCMAPGAAAPLVALQLVHRSMALLVGGLMLVFATHAWRRWSWVPGARVSAVALAGLLAVTAAIGGVVGVLGAPPAWQDAHLAVAAAVLVTVITLATLGWLAAADGQPPPGKGPAHPCTPRVGLLYRGAQGGRSRRRESRDGRLTDGRSPHGGGATTSEVTSELIESTHVSLGGEIGSPQKWALPYLDDDHREYASGLLGSADALLPGRAACEGPSNGYRRMASNPLVDRMNTIPCCSIT